MKHFLQTGCQFEPLYLYAPVGLPYPSPHIPPCFFYAYTPSYQATPLLSASTLCLPANSPQAFLTIQGGLAQEPNLQKDQMGT